MKKHLGFSLVEVLVALSLFSFISVSLLKQHWHTSKLSQQQDWRFIALNLIDNMVEAKLAGSAKGFKQNQQLAEKTLPQGVVSHRQTDTIKLSWLHQDNTSETIIRAL